jgi:hypothetical protein
MMRRRARCLVDEQGRFVNGMMNDPGCRIHWMADSFGCRVNRVGMMGGALGLSVAAIRHGSAGENDGQGDGKA